MSNNFLNNFSQLKTNKNSYQGNTLRESQCINGFPVDKYSSYGGSNVKSWEVLYSIWVSYQNTLGAKFTYQQADF
jgi:hypothetical protein